jgi:hypothetical protein
MVACFLASLEHRSLTAMNIVLAAHPAPSRLIA